MNEPLVLSSQIVQSPANGHRPLSFAQQRLWVFEQLQPGNPVYVGSAGLRIQGSLDLVALARALEMIVSRHDVLRTVFREEEGVPVQIVSPDSRLKLRCVDLTVLPAADREAEVDRCLRRESRRPFDLSADLMLRAVPFQLAADKYLLWLTTHHIASDGWSKDVLLRELCSFYNAFVAGRSPDVSKLPIQYSDFALWQREWLTNDRLEAQLAYWKQQLAGAPAVLELPLDRVRPPAQTFNGCRELTRFPADLLDRLRALSRRLRATPFMILFAAFNALLYRHTGQEDIVVGSPISGRSRLETEPLIGFFVNNLVLRTDLSGNPIFADLVGRVRRVAIDAYGHQDVPFERLIEEVQVARDPAISPLFQVVFGLQNTPQSLLALEGATVEMAESDPGTAKFDLSVFVFEEVDGLKVQAEYNTDLFDRGTVTRLLEHYGVLLDEALRKPETRISDLPWLTPNERRRILVEWNDTARDYPRDRCLHELFEAQVRRDPDSLAVICETAQLTYAGLDARANALARRLSSFRAGPDVPVAICLERSVNLIVAIIAVLKVGGAYLPLEPDDPPDRQRFQIDDAAVSLVITESALADRFRPVQQVVVLNAEEPPDHYPDDLSCALSAPTSQNLAYIVYTSGSTGRPKGVAIEHRQIVNYVQGILERLDVPAGSSFASVSTVAADLGHTAIFGALSSGGCLHLITRDRARDPERLSDYMAQHPIDVLKIVPSHLAALLSVPRPERLMPRRALILGGEASRLEWVAHLQELAPDCKILNHYGPTEATVGATTCGFGTELLSTRSGTLPLGRPLPNITAYVLDANQHPAPIGAAGELFLGGAGVARGYVNRPSETAARFIPDSFSRLPGGRLYRTGDRVRYLENGCLEFLGRNDRQLKIRGYRIEPDEIEAALRQHPAVEDAIVVARERPTGAAIVAYLVPRSEKWGDGPGAYRLPDGSWVRHLNRSETNYIYDEIFIREAYLRHGIELRDGDCVFDVGANIGLFSLWVSRICRASALYAFEPNPAAFEALRANLVATGVPAKPLKVALSNACRTGELTVFKGFSLLSGFHADTPRERGLVHTFVQGLQPSGPDESAAERLDELLEDRFQETSYAVEVRTISSVIAEDGIERIDLLKINVERSELEVLEGIAADDWRRIRQLVLEVDSDALLDPILELLTSQGYEVAVEQDPRLANTQLRYVYAVRHSGGRQIQRGPARVDYHESSSQVPVRLGSDLRAYLARRLPEHMVPESYVLLEAFPLTPNGKIDIAALPESGAEGQPSLGRVRALNGTEERIATVWREVLGLDQVDPDSNFFDLGGHSLLAIRVAARLRRVFEGDLPLRWLFDNATLSELAAAIDESQRRGSVS